MQNATIRIAMERVIGEVHDHLYGANLEHLGQAVYGGLWAEMLRDRKFAGCDSLYTAPSEGLCNAHPSIGIVLPWEAVNPDYEAAHYAHDNTVFYTGRQSQRVSIRQNDSQPRGLKQGSLYLEDERDYALRLVVKGQGQSLRVQLGDEEIAFDDLREDWQTIHHTFKRAGHHPKGELRMTIRAGTVWIGCASLMPTDNIDGFRADLIAAIRDWSPTQLRWPGGNFVSAYHWRDGVGERDKRPAYLDPAWWLWESNDVGTEEFIQLCRLVNAEPVLTVNMGDGTIEEARAWLEYCNGLADTEYGALRMANGHAEPHDVRVWFLGNEQYGNWQVGHVDAETYARKYLDFAGAMRAVDDDLTLIGVGVPVDLYAHWNEQVLRIASAEMDQFSLHYYSVRTEKLDDSPGPEAAVLPKLAACHEAARMLDDTLAVMDQHSDRPLPLAFDEWNTYVSAKPPDYIEDYNLSDALYTASLMNLCLNRADRVKYSAIYHLVNVMGCYLAAPLYEWEAVFLGRGGGWAPMSTGDNPDRPAVIKMPATLVLELMTRYRGPRALAASVDCETFASPAMGSMPAFDDVPLLSAAATIDEKASLLYVSVAHCGLDEPMRIHLPGFDQNAEVELRLITGDSPTATNTFASPNSVVIAQDRMPLSQLTLPPHSFAMLILQF